MPTALLTLDAGTTGLKCTLFTPGGEVLASCVREYSVDYPHPGWAQQDTSLFSRSTVESIRQVLSVCPDADIAAIGLSGTMNGCIPVSAQGEALYPNIIHLDTRTLSQVEEIRSVIGEEDFYRCTGNRLDPHYSLPKILWLKENLPEVYAKTRYFINTKDWIFGFLTGVFGATDYSDAGLTAALDLNTMDWNRPLLAQLGLDVSRMPRLLPAHTAAGTLRKEIAEQTGLKCGIPVCIGAGDGACASHGAGLYAPGKAYMNIGSSAWIISLSEKPLYDPERRSFCYPDMDAKHFDVCGTVQCGAAALDWAVTELFGLPAEGSTYRALEDLARTVPAGSGGVLFLPTLMGERTPWWDAQARGTLIGAGLHHTRAHLARAVFEGIAQELHLCDRVLRENGMAYESLTLIGGGAKSTLWPQMIADMFDVQVRVHADARQATSLGAAIAAGVGVGLYSTYEEASRIIRTGDALLPRESEKAAYARHTQIFAPMYPLVRDACHLLSAFQSEGR